MGGAAAGVQGFEGGAHFVAGREDGGGLDGMDGIDGHRSAGNVMNGYRDWKVEWRKGNTGDMYLLRFPFLSLKTWGIGRGIEVERKGKKKRGR